MYKAFFFSFLLCPSSSLPPLPLLVPNVDSFRYSPTDKGFGLLSGSLANRTGDCLFGEFPLVRCALGSREVTSSSDRPLERSALPSRWNVSNLKISYSVLFFFFRMWRLWNDFSLHDFRVRGYFRSLFYVFNLTGRRNMREKGKVTTVRLCIWYTAPSLSAGQEMLIKSHHRNNLRLRFYVAPCIIFKIRLMINTQKRACVCPHSYPRHKLQINKYEEHKSTRHTNPLA